MSDKIPGPYDDGRSVPPPAYGAAPYPGAPTQPSYPQPYAASAPYPYPTARNNTLAVISLVASIVGIVGIIPVLGSIAGVIMGHISLNQIKRNSEQGRGLALAGLIVGYVGLALWIIGILGLVLFFTALVSHESSFGA